MAIKKNKYINVELEFAEEQLKSWELYVKANPYESLKDRIEWKATKGGGVMPMVIASIESQHKNIRDTVKDYLAMLEVVNKLRGDEEEAQKARKGGFIPYDMKKKSDGS